METISILVVLAPAIACAVLGLVVEVGPKFSSSLKSGFASKNVVVTLKELASHTAFFGGVVGAFVGLHTSLLHALAAVVWFIGFLSLSIALSFRVDVIEEAEAEEHHERIVLKIMSEIAATKVVMEPTSTEGNKTSK